MQGGALVPDIICLQIPGERAAVDRAETGLFT